MSGIYFHIPFCKTRCFYCDFHTSTDLNLVSPLMEAMMKELRMRQNYLDKDRHIQTIYFGGGTPSLLSPDQIGAMIQEVKNLFLLSDKVEVTVEANPDDLNRDYLKGLLHVGVNRLSMGVQSTSDCILKSMNRRHSVEDVFNAINNAVDIGLDNISIDLIYGVPGLSPQLWKTELESIIALPVDHISAYHLTYHKGTEYYRRLKKGTLTPVTEEDSLAHFDILTSVLDDAGFEQYEISNFCRNNKISNHNSAYWRSVAYLGIGPSAHSFDGINRQWNVSDNQEYINSVSSGDRFYEIEHLTNEDRYNDYIITSFRTKWGVCDQKLSEYGPLLREFFLRNVDSFVENGEVINQNGNWIMTKKGFIRSDLIIEKVFYYE